DPFSGTSAAAPHVAGAAALVKQAYPQASPAEIRAFLQGRALDVGAAGRDTQTGVGRLWLGTPPANLVGSSMGVAAPRLSPGAPVTYTIRLVNSGGVTVTGRLVNPLPATLVLTGTPTVDGVVYKIGSDVLEWRGSLGPARPVTIVYTATLQSPKGGGPLRVVNGARLTDNEGRVYGLGVALNPLRVYLPAVIR
ncbi:MAG: S8 family serine peptidase, partial [Caldilineaceae bacterium]